MNLLVLFAPSRLLKPILDRAGVKPRIVDTRPNKPPRSRKVVGGGGRARPGRRKKIAQINGRATAPGTLQVSNHSIGFIAAM